MTKAYAIFAPDCDAYYYDGAQESLFCKSCGSFIGEKTFYPEQLLIRDLKYDFCFTYDGQLLLSEKAKGFLEKRRLDGVSFKKVNRNPSIFVLIVDMVALFDVKKRKTKFENLCNLCGDYESIAGAAPPFLKNSDKIIESNLYVTDVKFGSGREKSPVYIAGGKLGKALKKEFREIDLEEVRK